jgi:uncharacterized Zn finger protein
VGVALADLIDRDDLLRLAGPRSYGRGCEYLEWGAVERIERSGEGVAAWVQGGERYRVRLFVDGGRLGFDCTCPVGRQMGFCKHCVATALACDGVELAPRPALDGLEQQLVALGSERLAGLLVEHARSDDRLAQRLHALTLREDDGLDVAAHRALLDSAIVVHGYVAYGEAWGYFEGVAEALDTLDDLLDDGHPDAVVELAEHALRRVEAALERVDDSDGGGSEAIERIERLHLAACERADVDGVALAERLLAWELESDLGVFDEAIARYADVLGERGRDRYDELARERWAEVPVREPGDHDDYEHFAIAHVMEALAARSGRVDDIVAVRARDLSSGWRFVGIAELLREHGRHDDALRWVERGLAAFPDGPDPRLVAFAVEEYRRRGRSQDALALTEQAFTQRPGVETWKALRRDAEALGDWERRRPEALRTLAECIDDPGRSPRGAGYRDRSELVHVHLYEDEAEAAWREASDGGCSRALWLELAQRRRADHPDDALAVFKREVELTIEGRDRQAYAAAVKAMGRVRELLEANGREGDYAAYVAEVRATHKRKRNLVKLLDGTAAA